MQASSTTQVASAGTYSLFPSRNYEKIGSYKQDTKNFTKFSPSEFKLGGERVTLNDVYSRTLFLARHSQVPKEIIKKDEGKWINKFFDGSTTLEETIQFLKSFGFSDEEAKELLGEAIYHSERASDWSIANENYGGLAANSILLSAGFGVLKSVLDEFDLLSPFTRRTIDIFHNSTAAARGYLQYGYVYGGRNDDEIAKNNYEGESYRNLTSSFFADFAYLFETKINPISLTLIALTSEKTQSALTPLLFLSNILWWRIRMLAEIRQDFGTDLFTYLFHKPLAFIKINESVRKVKEIKDRGHLNYPYIQRRLVELLGLDPSKHRLNDIFPELAKSLKDIFDTDKEIAKCASHNIGKLLAPFFGFYGFVAIAIGIPLKSVLKWLDLESKYINALAASGITSQQLLYLFRMMLPEQFENENYDGKNLEIRKLKSQRNYLFYTGLANFSGSIIGTILKLLNSDRRSIKLGNSTLDELVDKGISYYFSRRRELRGKAHRLSNPELFNLDGTQKIISDKVCAEEKPQTIAA